MWISDLQTAFQELFDIYEYRCCVERIVGCVITMTSGDKWIIGSDGHIHKYTN